MLKKKMRLFVLDHAASCKFCRQDIESRKSPLKYPGGKSWIVPTIKPFWHNYGSYVGAPYARLVEPLAGSCAVTLALNPKQALLNDVNDHLINFYRWVRQNGLPQPIEVNNTEIDYYRLRRDFNNLIKTPRGSRTATAAYLFYYLNRTGFRGLCRFNQQGQFNVPYGNYETIHYMREFIDYKILFNNWSFSFKDFEKLQIKETDFLYLDPPYCGNFVSYTPGGFSWHDQERLAEWASKLSCTVLASNSNNPKVIHLYKSLGFKVTELDAPRRIDPKRIHNSAKEMLAGRNLR